MIGPVGGLLGGAVLGKDGKPVVKREPVWKQQKVWQAARTEMRKLKEPRTKQECHMVRLRLTRNVCAAMKRTMVPKKVSLDDCIQQHCVTHSRNTGHASSACPSSQVREVPTQEACQGRQSQKGAL